MAMTSDEMIAVIEAWREGVKQIEYCPHGGVWADFQYSAGPAFDFTKNDYRIKPEPKKPRVWTLRQAGPLLVAEFGPILESGEMVRVSEVL